MYQLRDKNSNCGDSILAKFNNYRSYGIHFYNENTYIFQGDLTDILFHRCIQHQSASDAPPTIEVMCATQQILARHAGKDTDRFQKIDRGRQRKFWQHVKSLDFRNMIH